MSSASQLPPIQTMSQDRTPLPPGHFLSLPPSYSDATPSHPSGVPTTSSHESNGLAPNVASLASADFEVDVRTGFLPASANVSRLEGSHSIWEDALDAARGQGVGGGLQLGGKRTEDKLWRKAIEDMPVLDASPLRASQGHLRRAHLVLTFLLHFYVHISPPTSPHALPIPASIAVPLMTVSPLLGLPPIVTYSDTVLWNFHPANPATETSLVANPPAKTLASFTNTRSEDQFYLISALCEIAGAEALRLMRRSLDELFLGDELALKRLTVFLRKLAVQIEKVGDITSSMIKEIDPEEFYHLIRPWFRGADAGGSDSPGWFFTGVDDETIETPTSAAENASRDVKGKGKGRLFSGPSAGQSSLIHAIDVFLTVDHSPKEEEIVTEPRLESNPTITKELHLNHSPVSPPSSASSSSSSSSSTTTSHTTPATSGHSTPAKPPTPNESTFLQRMLEYMPLPHRTFLLHLSAHPTPLRPLVVAHKHSHPKLAEAYDGALEALKRFREKHMRVVSVFIVQQARRRPSPRIRRLIGEVVNDDEDEDDSNSVTSPVAPSGELRGTGGTPLFKFLKRCRDNTTGAMIGKPKGPTYELQ